ncbi:MAG: U32 family peptidase [bacterium]|nr:U32 family peptidase [bacterium]
MKSIVKINDKNNISYYSNNCDGFILGLKGFSVDYEEFTILEIENLVNTYSKKDIFISINKNIFNDELVLLKESLMKLSMLNIKGILFYDMSILYLKNKYSIEIDLVWNQTHMVTNYNTCNYYYNKGVKYGFISGELTIDEILEINNKSDMKFMTLIIGHQIMSHSKRKLLTNYYKSINKEFDNKEKYISEKTGSYIVKENETGTTFKTNDIVNGIIFIDKLKKLDYVVIDEDLIDKEIIKKLLICVYKNDIENSIELIGDNTSFFNKKTIYKVKKGTK